MQTMISTLRIKKELSSQLILVSADKRWLILLGALFFTVPLLLIGMLLLLQEETVFFGMMSVGLGLSFLVMILLFSHFKSNVVIDRGARTLTLQRTYWLGFVVLERTREYTWSFNDLTNATLNSQGWKKLVALETNGKKVLLLDFGRKAVDARRSYEVVQCWLKGLVPDSSVAVAALQELENESQNQQALKNAEKLLFYFGIFSLIDVVLSLYTDNSLETNFSTLTAAKLLTGVIYLACRYGVKHRFEIALWIAIAVLLAERLYWFILSTSLRGSTWSSWLTWVFAIFVVSSLWQAIQSIRAQREEPVYKPLA